MTKFDIVVIASLAWLFLSVLFYYLIQTSYETFP